MKLTVLCDNHTIIDRYYLGEPALSFYMEDEGEKILFDTGYSDVFLKNAKALGIDFSKLTAIVISHGHNDHTGGLRRLLDTFDLSGVKLIAHPQVFKKRRYEGLMIGSKLTAEECREYGLDVRECTKPFMITPRLCFLGEIPRRMPFEGKTPIGECLENGRWRPDFIRDDSALVYAGSEGPFVITGCSHSGICNILTQALSLSKKEKAAGVIGGFHLMQKDAVLEKTVSFLADTVSGCLYPCHCVCLEAKCEMARVLPVREVGVGMSLEII
jgi:7,8-dihydropterin-6-yl-methyl-4-(beta-D-ribofuranosyl)aminobenzene 5'-phosphate synthase